MQLNENVTVVEAGVNEHSESCPPPPFVASDSIEMVEDLEEDESAVIANPVDDELEVVNIEEYPEDNLPAIMITDCGQTNVVRWIFRCCFKCRIVAAALSLLNKLSTSNCPLCYITHLYSFHHKCIFIIIIIYEF